jgi:outer membrane protein TolC
MSLAVTLARSISLTFFLAAAGMLAIAPGAPQAAELAGSASSVPASPEIRHLSLDDARSLALERNLQLALSFEQVDEARSALAEVRAALGPSVALTASQSNQTTNLVAQGFPKSNGGPSLFPTLDGPFNSFDARLRFSQSIFDPRRTHLTRAGERQLAEAEHQRQSVEEQTLSAVELGYISVQQQTATLEAAEGNLVLSRELQTLAEDQRKAGVATGVDVARAETRVAQDRYAVAQSRSARDQALLRLKRVLGLPAAERIELASPLAFREILLPGAADAMTRAEAQRQELQVLDERIAAAEESVSAAKAESLPVVTLEAGLGPSGSTPTQTVYLTRSIGVGVSVPLFTAGLLDAHRDRARSLVRSSQLAREDARRQIEEDVHLALLALATAVEQVNAARTTLSLGERLLTLARDRFAQGVADNLEVLDALNSTTGARSRLIEAIASHTAARANLAAALGEARQFVL